MMKKIVNWVVLSSKDPNKFSLTVKGVLGGAVTLLTIFLGTQNIELPSEMLTAVVEAVVVAMQAFFALVSAVAVVWGAIRKILLTIKGQNKSIDIP